MMNFCRLPPDRLFAAASGPLALTRKLRISARRARATSPTRISRGCRPCAVRVSSVFCASESVGTAPRPRRSSGTKCSPRAAPARGEALAMSRRRARSSPRARACPRPRSRPSARVARCRRRRRCRRPRRRARRDRCPRASAPNGSRLAARARAPERDVAGRGGARCRRGGSAPIIRRERLALVSLRGSTSPVTRPPRRTVQLWQSARISSSLWLM